MVDRPRLAVEEVALFSPDSTPIPNYASDELFSLAGNIGMNEFSIFLLLCRCTFAIMQPCSYTDVEILAHTGRDTRRIDEVKRALERLERQGYIHIYHTSKGRAIIPDYYADIIPAPDSEQL
jgi:hypothetical protein